MPIRRTIDQIIQENLINAQKAAQEMYHPVSEKNRTTGAWERELKQHYNWIVTYDKGDKRKNALIDLAGGGIRAGELFSLLNQKITKTTIYDKMYDARKRPDIETAQRAIQCLELKDERAEEMLHLLGWHNALGVDRRSLLDNMRAQEHWMGECGGSLEKIAECLFLADGTIERLRQNGTYIDSYTAFRVIITLSGCKTARDYGESLSHFFGIHMLEDGESDRIAKICASAYEKILNLLREQAICNASAEKRIYEDGSRAERQWERRLEVEAHQIFWGMMFSLLKKYDGAYHKNFASAFFAKQNMEALDINGKP